MNLQPTQKHNNGETKIPSPNLPIPNNDIDFDIDSSCSTPYVSAPSSPGRGPNTDLVNNGGFFYSAPTSPMHFAISSSSFSKKPTSFEHSISSFEFESANGSMSSADELFLNGQIRPMKLSSHLQRPQALSPLMDVEHEEDDEIEVEDGDFDRVLVVRGRDLRNRTSSLRRRTRSLSPLRNSTFPWQENDGVDLIIDNVEDEDEQFRKTKFGNLGLEETEEKQSEIENRASGSASSSRCSSAGRSSKRWVFLKDFLYRSKSEGTSSPSTVKFWSKSKYPEKTRTTPPKSKSKSENSDESKNGVENSKRPTSNGFRKPSPHELHYTKNRAQAEEMRKKTFLPYKQGLFGCLGFSSKGYGAMNGLFARSLNPVSSR